MSKLLSICLLVFVLLGMVINTAEAARFGGGRSFGAQRSMASFSRQSPAGAYPQAASANRWMAPLAGLAAGGLLAYLLMGHGIGSGLLTWLAIFGIGSLLWSFLRNKTQLSSPQSQYNNQYSENNVFDARSRFGRQSGGTSTPPGFSADNFLRDAKVQFIRMQAAYDVKDLNDLRQFTAPEVFAEIQLQLQERGDEPNKTEVVSLNAELLDTSTEYQSTLASVKFSGMIREVVNEPAAPFSEVWHFRKDLLSNNWLVAGIQQDLS